MEFGRPAEDLEAKEDLSEAHPVKPGLVTRAEDPRDGEKPEGPKPAPGLHAEPGGGAGGEESKDVEARAVAGEVGL